MTDFCRERDFLQLWFVPNELLASISCKQAQFCSLSRGFFWVVQIWINCCPVVRKCRVVFHWTSGKNWTFVIRVVALIFRGRGNECIDSLHVVWSVLCFALTRKGPPAIQIVSQPSCICWCFQVFCDSRFLLLAARCDTKCQKVSKVSVTFFPVLSFLRSDWFSSDLASALVVPWLSIVLPAGLNIVLLDWIWGR